MRTRAYFLILCASLFTSMCTTKKDDFSYALGAVGAFSEMVNAGAKRLALSTPLSPEEMDAFKEEAEKIANRHDVLLYRESELIITSLFPEDIVEGKDVLLIYKGTTLDEYQSLKAEINALKEAGAYEGKAKEELARRFGRLLSYTPKKINQLLAGNTTLRTLSDFGIQATNLFLYYKDLDRATTFYTETLGMELMADYQMAKILRMTHDSYLILVDATKGMHTAEEPKTVALALLTNQLEGWYAYLQEKGVSIKYTYKPKDGGPHDGFVAVDPEGYLLEFEMFKQHPENEKFIPLLKNKSETSEKLGFYATITWLYYKDVLAMQHFYEQKLGFDLLVDQGWAKIYQSSRTGFVGLVDERRGMHAHTEKKAVNVSFILRDVEGWFEYVKQNNSFLLRSDSVSTGPEHKYRAFVGYDPEGYYMEFDQFYDHADNALLMKCLEETESR